MPTKAYKRNLNNAIAKLRVAVDCEQIEGLIIGDNEVAALLIELDHAAKYRIALRKVKKEVDAFAGEDPCASSHLWMGAGMLIALRDAVAALEDD